MRVSDLAEIPRQGRKEQIGQQNLTRFFKRSHSVLALPKLDQDVPTAFSQGEDLQNLAILALNLLRRGMIDKDATGETLTLVQEAISKWVADSTGTLDYFDLEVKVIPEVTDIVFSNGDDAYLEYLREHKEVIGKNPMFLTFTPEATYNVTIGKKLQAIEESSPGLGKTAYYWLATAGAKTFEVYTPWFGTTIAERTWWYGEDNQNDYIEAIKEYNALEDQEEIDEFLQNGISPDSWAASFPTWVTRPENSLSQTDLEIIANDNSKPLDSKVAAAVLALIDNQNGQLPAVYGTGLEPVYNSIYLHWQTGDMSGRLVDDYIEEINMSGGEGYTEMLGVSGIPYKKKAFDSWVEDMTAGFIQLKNLDTLINLIGIRDN